MDKDYVITPTSQIPNPQLAKKPAYLIVLQDGKFKQYFVTIEKPECTTGVSAKGFFTLHEEGYIAENFIQLIGETSKEEFKEIFFPMHRVIHVRSLVFKAK